MGRGRAKAKQTKVARELKYRPQDTDFSQLQRELRGGESAPAATEPFDTDDAEDEADGYAAPYSRYATEDEAS